MPTTCLFVLAGSLQTTLLWLEPTLTAKTRINGPIKIANRDKQTHLTAGSGLVGAGRETQNVCNSPLVE